ncbi:MAG: type II toxin-antitoxin system HicA family toxin, partial [Candidatus Thermoplasmatota archaeon]|nr:type II toxin-antitoxin system HicA family toxin [Candidatus Thermoplasmatota archaeon]
NPETKRRAVVPIHRKDLPRGTLMEILRQAGFSREELDEALGR